ncbi:hypothetical protein M441DRAFT_142076 [Trichoderma asperellum CBS 433.97]|uniref:Uncharacterized protein n=1 Tax=Trichoderma asperellum (strain ATCC 204424 / CBS 433.97 / NBRC 101777) TaxID=1042311 RepID=A0A2T3Z520_TRIA4|nr:hypothetical protein M441DRAFT_142076 [Trichoderma asperellum CBS 433.97]PTB39902.1 hypothetical protein M441DRAFT_142076 [Trichoderma asperellum CBS 433.97]
MARADNNSKAHSYEPVQVVKVDSESQKSTTSDYKRYAIYSPSEWLLEFISSTAALGLVIAIAIIFRYMDNKPLSAWNGLLSLNATISILTTAYAIVLMQGVSTFIGQAKWLYIKNKPRRLADFEIFDRASRDIWGSLLLLTTVRWNLATIGAVIVILRLAFSPFAQQVVLIEQRDIISPPADTATFGYAHGYSREAVFNSLSNSGVGSTPQDAGMQNAIYQGLYGVKMTEPFNCPGVCTWPGSYTSLGFHAECRNVTQQTLQTARCAYDNENVMRQCNMTTPGGVMVKSHHVDTDSGTTYYMNTSSLLYQYSQSGGSYTPKQTFPEITRFAIYRSTVDYNFNMQNINVTECSLYITAYEYTDAKANGSDFSFASKREIDFGVKNPWHLAPPNSSINFQRIVTNETTRGGIQIPALEIDFPNLQTLATFLSSPSIVSEFVEGDFVNTNLGIAAALYGDVNLSDRFDGMATAMTNYLRYGPNTQLALGEVIQSEPFVSIRWGYFAVPIATEALAIIFAILSIVSSRRSRGVPLWKSSTLAVLACQHNEQLELLQTTGKGINEIQAVAKRSKVQLQ